MSGEVKRCECGDCTFDEYGICEACGGRVDGALDPQDDEERACNLCNGVLSVVPTGSPNEFERCLELIALSSESEAVRVRARVLVERVLASVAFNNVRKEVQSVGERVATATEEFLSRGRAAQDAVDEAQRRAELAETPSPGERVVKALERALRNAPEATTHAADALIVFDVLRRWYGDGAQHVLTAALELAKVDAVK